MLIDLFPADERTALIEAATGERRSFAELTSAVRRFAEGAAPWEGGLAFVYVANRMDDVVAYLGCRKAGLAVALLDAGLAAERQAALRAAYAPELILGGAAVSSPSSARSVRLGEGHVAWAEVGRVLSPVAPQLGLCLSTSGSTGSPKFVRLSGENLVANARSIVAALDIESSEVALAHLPFHYSYGLSILHSHLLAGSTVVLTSESALRPGFLAAVAAHDVTTIPNVPFGYALFERVGFREASLPSVRVLTQAGGRLPPELADRYHAHMTSRGGKLHIMYGQTEGTARLSVLHSDDYTTYRGSVGRAVPGGSFEVLDPDPSGRGAIRYRGPNVMLGYASDRAGLARGDDNLGVLDTGDAGRLDGDVLTVSGRLGRVAKVFGLRFDLDEVEHLAARFGTVAVVEGSDQLLVFAERHDDEQCRDLHRVLARQLRLPPAGVHVESIERLPRTAAGKVAYARLKTER